MQSHYLMGTTCMSSDHIHCHVFWTATGAVWNNAYHEDSRDTMSHLTGKWNFFSYQKIVICNGQPIVWVFWFYCLRACMQQSTSFLPLNFLPAHCLISSQEASDRWYSTQHRWVSKELHPGKLPSCLWMPTGKILQSSNFLTELEGTAEHSSPNTGQK